MTYEWRDALKAGEQSAMWIPNGRDPRKYRVGYFSGTDFVLDSARVFMWFASVDEMLAWVVEGEPKIYSPEEPSETEKFENAAKEAAAVRDSFDEMRDALNRNLRRIMAVEWLGSYDELLAGNSEFAATVREAFWESEAEEDEETNSRSIPSNKKAAFVEYLSQYGV